MSSDSSQEHVVPFYPPLPVELIREVFEHIVLTDKSCAPSLALVSRNFYNWITPLMYHTVTLDSQERILSFIRCIEAAQCLFVDNTRHIFSLAIYIDAMKHCDWTLSLCGNIQSLLLWPDKYDESSQSAEGVELWPHPWHVVIIDLLTTEWLIPRLSLFTHTTHLHLEEVLNPQILSICLEMQSLTHICFVLYGEHNNPEVALRGTRLLLEKSSIKLVLVNAFISGIPIGDFYGGIWASLADIPDERLFVMPGLRLEQLFELFESGRTVWDSVEAWKDWRHAVQAEHPIFSET